MSTSFHNTTNEVGPRLLKFENDCFCQKIRVLQIFKDKKTRLSASEVFNEFPTQRTPITSIRRAMSNLKKAGILRKLKEKKIGLYGSPENYYELI